MPVAEIGFVVSRSFPGASWLLLSVVLVAASVGVVSWALAAGAHRTTLAWATGLWMVVGLAGVGLALVGHLL